MKVFLDSVGCRLNQAEIEQYAAQFLAIGYSLVDSAADADIVVINTCAVTAAAGSDSRQRIRQAAKAGNAKIITTGCLATLEPDAVLSLPHVFTNIKNELKDGLVSLLIENDQRTRTGEPRGHADIPGSRHRMRAFIKAQDGCDNFCTYCITRLARGKSRSRCMDAIVTDIAAAQSSGVKEIVLTGVQLGSWGHDLAQQPRLEDLVNCILDRTNIERIRLSSVEPWEMGDGFFQIWKNPRVCRQLHMPLQSGSDRILKLMGRKNTIDSFQNLVERVRAASPDIALTTDILVGFPGETDDDFRQTMKMLERVGFAGGHVFTFSPRPGTPAAGMPGQVDWQVKKSRNRATRGKFVDLQKQYETRFLGKVLNVLWETAEPMEAAGFRNTGWTDNYMRCELIGSTSMVNSISSVRLEKLEKGRFQVAANDGIN